MAEKEDLVQRAKLAEQAERYDDMAQAMRKVSPASSFSNLGRRVPFRKRNLTFL